MSQDEVRSAFQAGVLARQYGQDFTANPFFATNMKPEATKETEAEWRAKLLAWDDGWSTQDKATAEEAQTTPKAQPIKVPSES